MNANPKTTLDALPDLLFEVDETGRIFDYRAMQPELLAVPPEKFMGKRMDEVLPAGPSAVIKRAIKEAMDKGHHSGGTYSLQMPDGLHWYELSIAVKDNSDPAKIRLIVLVRDITSRKQSDEALIESEEKFRTLAQVTSALIFIHRNREIIYANPQAANITGYSEKELLGTDFMKFIHPEFHELIAGRVKERTRGKQNMGEVETKIVRKDGTERWLVYSGETIQINGSPAVLGTAFDITDIKLFEASLAESEEQFRTLAEVTDAMIFIYQNQKTIYANPASIAKTGYSLKELLKKNFIEFIHPDYRAVTAERVKSRMAGKRDLSKLEIKIVCKDGEERWISYSADLIQFQGERAVLGTAYDITDHKRIEKALNESESLARQQLEELETIYRNMPVGLCLLDRKFRHVRINEQLAKFNGRSISEHMGLSVREVIPNLADKIEPILQSVLDTGQAVLGLEMSGTSPIDPITELHWILSYYPVMNPGGAVEGIGVVVTDITERKATEELLRTRTNELKSERIELQGKNTALKEILFSLEKERQKFKSLICRDIQQAITPILQKLRRTAGAKNANEINLLDENLKSILLEDVDIFRDRYAGLTSREIDISDMIKDGLSSKEISAKLDLSVLTIHKHREQIRKKLGIANKKINLSTYLRLHI